MIYLIIFTIIFFCYLFAAFNIMADRNRKAEKSFKILDNYFKKRRILLINIISFARYVKEEKMASRLEFLMRQDYDHLTILEKLITNADIDNMIQKLILIINELDIKEDVNFINLNKQLIMIEEEINNASNYYNKDINNYNKIISFFPNNLLAKMANLNKKNKYEGVKINFEIKQGNNEVIKL